MDVDIDRLPVGRRNEAHLGRRDQSRGDQRAAKIVHLGSLEPVSLIETGNCHDVAGRERRLAGDADFAEAGNGSRLHRKHQAGGLGFVVDFDLLIADFGQSETFLAERDLKVGARLDDILGYDRVAGFDGEGLAKARSFLARRVKAGKLH